jgi:hypothetical protein
MKQNRKLNDYSFKLISTLTNYETKKHFELQSAKPGGPGPCQSDEHRGPEAQGGA